MLAITSRDYLSHLWNKLGFFVFSKKYSKLFKKKNTTQWFENCNIAILLWYCLRVGGFLWQSSFSTHTKYLFLILWKVLLMNVSNTLQYQCLWKCIIHVSLYPMQMIFIVSINLIVLFILNFVFNKVQKRRFNNRHI